MRTDIAGILKNSHNLDEESYNLITSSIKKKVELYHPNSLVRFFRKHVEDHKTIHLIKTVLRKKKMPKSEMRQIIALVDNDIKLNRKIERLATMQNLFKYWHVVHSPFALVMLIIMAVHVGVTIAFGYRWIF
jgi:predicted nucleic acid-binding protein